MIIEKVLEIISFKQSKWLEKHICLKTQKQNRAVNEFEKKTSTVYGKTMEKVRTRLKVDFVKKDDNDKNTKQQSIMTFNAIHKSYTFHDSQTVKQNEVLMDKQIYLRFAILELSKLLMYETYYVKLQPYFEKIYTMSLHRYGRICTKLYNKNCYQRPKKTLRHLISAI